MNGCISFPFVSFFFLKEKKKRKRILFLKKLFADISNDIGYVRNLASLSNDIIQDQKHSRKKISLSKLKFLKRDYTIIFTSEN